MRLYAFRGLIAVWRAFIRSPAAISLAVLAVVPVAFAAAHARTTGASASGGSYIEIVAREGVPVFAVRSFGGLRSRLYPYVFSSGDGAEMFRIDAASHFANMVNLATPQDRSIEVFAGQSMGKSHAPTAVAFTTHNHESIASMVSSTGPEPAAGFWVYGDFGEEASQFTRGHSRNITAQTPIQQPFGGGRGFGPGRLQD